MSREPVQVYAAMGIASSRGWTNLWLEGDSQLTILAIKNPDMFPWKIRSHWKHALTLCKDFSFIYSHVIGNTCG
ncbi:hypothetical protein GmHk_08G023674 [Glycine max]|nr:hypothetical protein GmHk_08G023674 [Glycine max]